MTRLLVVTGAPGSGKSTTVEALLGIDHEFMVFDIDWLIEQGSDFLGRRIQDSPDRWKPWGHLWFEVLHSVVRNGQTPIFFCPNSIADFNTFGLPDWVSTVKWLLLNCDEADRRRRLEDRSWSEVDIDDALKDAQELENLGLLTISTSQQTPVEVAEGVLHWARSDD